jgi:hypothetical protein
MGTLTTAIIVFVVTAGAGLTSLTLGQRLPNHHLDADSRDTVRLVASFIAALAALVLGLLVASAKANYDERSGQMHHIAADIVALDRALAQYGSGAREARAILRAALIDELGRLSSGNRLSGSGLVGPVQDTRLLTFLERIQALAPQTPGQAAARDRASQVAESIATTRVLLTQDPGGSIPSPFLLVLGFWLVVMFASFGLFARSNAIVVTALLAGATSVAGAIFLILELDRPLDGLMRLSTEPLRHAVETVGR